MEAPTSASSQQIGSIQAQHMPSGQRGSRRARGGRGGGRGGNAPLALRPASVAPASQQSLDPSSPEHSGAESGRGRGTRRGRGGRPPQDRTVNGRQFGGQLTTNGTDAAQASVGPNQLQGDAPAFVPGQAPAAPRLKQKPATKPRPPQKRQPKSQAADIATRTHEDIDNGYYECPICTSEVQRKAKVWSCHTCWTVFHLSCIKKWSSNEGSVAAQSRVDGEAAPPRQWRCPGCNLPKDELPKDYTCWCGKELEPRSPAGVPPHSCAQTCGKERARKCPHPCEMTCHAGPCPPCGHMNAPEMCFCGKHEVTKRCSETDYDNGWSCGEVCSELMPCGEHEHDGLCHPGLCGACEVLVPARCYCGAVEKEIECSERGEEKESLVSPEGSDGSETLWTGTFDCENDCGRPFDCCVEDHVCHRPCHPQELEAGHCPRSPDVVKHCSCGKTPLSDLTEKVRESCKDPIPSCLQACGKPNLCGHQCTAICHTGSCPPCREVIDIKCRCGRTTSRSLCHQGHTEPPQCMRVCRTALNCGRHACDERCCTGEKKAIERQAVKKKQRPLSAAPRTGEDGFEAEHICTRECGRLLKCGQHDCQELCHKGGCGTCREAIFEEISCHCGRTVLTPPLPCGTKPPPCRHPCRRPKACGHPQVQHVCHGDDEACPKCPFLVEKRCMCGKHTLKNQPCWLQDVRCGEICGKKLRCGSHHCRQPCHRLGHCEDEDGQACKQPCGKPKKVCGHPDLDLCHSPFSCKEEQPCQSKLFITCACQAQKQEMKCGASKNSEGNTGKTLPCNEACARLERNRRLALALNIDQSAHTEGGDHVPYSTETLNLFAAHVKWSQTQEREFRVFATSDDEKRLRFKPMKARERAFVHALAEDFGLDSESMDPEPHRHVMIWKTPRFVSAPNKTLAEALRIRTGIASATASANVSDNEGTGKKVKASNEVGEPYNGFIISHPRFGLTVDELRSELAKLQTLAVTFEVAFLPSDEVVLKALSKTLSAQELDHALQGLKPTVATAVASRGFGTVQLCATDSSLNIMRRESDAPSGDGWSRVAAKRAAPKFLAPTAGVGGTNSFAALTGGNKVTFAKKKPEKVKKPKAVVVDDWEAAELAEEEREKVTSGEEDGSALASPGLGDDVAAETSNVATLPAAAVVDAAESGEDSKSPAKDDDAIAEPAVEHNAQQPTETPSWAEQVEEAQ